MPYSIDVDQSHGFRSRVIAFVAAVPHGKVVTYGQVAAEVGAPLAARQVGSVLHGLNDHDRVPWHRVINAKGGISTYKVGAGELQTALLKSEGVAFSQDGTVNLDLYRWHPDGGPSPI